MADLSNLILDKAMYVKKPFAGKNNYTNLFDTCD